MTPAAAVEDDDFPRDVGLRPRQSLAFAVAYVALVVVGRATVLPGGTGTLVWPAAGVAVLWLLAERPDRQVRVLAPVGALLAVVLLLDGATVSIAAVGFVGVVLQTWLVVALVRRWCPSLLGAGGDRSVHTFRILAVGTGIVLLGCLVGAAVFAVGLWAAGSEPDVETVALIWGRQVAGTLAVGSVGHLGWERLRGGAGARIDGGTRAELVAFWVVSTVLMAVVFVQPLPLVFIVVPLSVWGASRFTTFTAALHACALGTVALVLTIAELGPLEQLEDRYVQAMLTQVFLLTLLMTALAVGTLRDRVDELVVQLTAAQARSDAQAELLSGMTESMGEGLVVLDTDGAVITHNAAAARLARRHLPGAGDAALVGLLDVVERPADPGEWRRPELGPGDVVVALPDGSEMVLAVTSRPLGAGGLDRLLVLRDVTAHRTGLRPLVEFAATAAHDLRGPLTAMRNWLSLVDGDLAETGQEELREPIRRVDHSIVLMSELIDDLLAQAAAEGGRLRPEDVALSGPDGLVADVATLAGMTDEVVVAADAPAVHADPAAVRQLFANLIGNCAKYARPGAAPHVEVDAHIRSDRVVVEVRDHGIGVAEEDRERIFDRFERSGAVQRSYAGTGLGLSLCRTIVERHGGHIECLAPADGPGAVFRFDLPAPEAGARS